MKIDGDMKVLHISRNGLDSGVKSGNLKMDEKKMFEMALEFIPS